MRSATPVASKSWLRYINELSDLPGLTIPPEPGPDARHARHNFGLAVDPSKAGIDRDSLIEALRAENIGTGIHFTPIHFFDYYKNKYKINPDDLRFAGVLGSRVLSIPLTPYLSDSDVDDVVRAMRRIVLYHARKSA